MADDEVPWWVTESAGAQPDPRTVPDAGWEDIGAGLWMIDGYVRGVEPAWRRAVLLAVLGHYCELLSVTPLAVVQATQLRAAQRDPREPLALRRTDG